VQDSSRIRSSSSSSSIVVAVVAVALAVALAVAVAVLALAHAAKVQFAQRLGHAVAWQHSCNDHYWIIPNLLEAAALVGPITHRIYNCFGRENAVQSRVATEDKT